MHGYTHSGSQSHLAILYQESCVLLIVSRCIDKLRRGGAEVKKRLGEREGKRSICERTTTKVDGNLGEGTSGPIGGVHSAGVSGCARNLDIAIAGSWIGHGARAVRASRSTWAK